MEYIAENVAREYTNKNELKKAYELALKEIEKTEIDENREVLHVDITGEIFLVNDEFSKRAHSYVAITDQNKRNNKDVKRIWGEYSRNSKKRICRYYRLCPKSDKLCTVLKIHP